MKRALSILIIMVILCGCASESQEVTVITRKKAVKTIEVHTQNISDNITLSGNVVPVNQAQLSFKLSGVIDNIYVKEGDFVKKGQKIASLKKTDYNIQKDAANAAKSGADLQIQTASAGIAGAQAQAEAAQAQIETAQAGLEASIAQRDEAQMQIDITIPEKLKQAEAQLKLTESNYDNIKQLYNNGVATKNQFDEITAKLAVDKSTYQQAVDAKAIAEEKIKSAEAQIKASEAVLNSAKAAYAAAEAQINASISQTGAAQANANAAQAGVEAAQNSINDTEIYSTLNGVVLKKVMNVGETVSAGYPIAVVGTTDKMWVQVGVPDQYIDLIKKGQNADIHIYGLSKTISGVIDEIGAAADTTTRTFTVKILANNSENTLKSGMICKTDIKLSDSKGYLIPIESVINLPDGDAVYIVENGNAVKKSVKSGQIKGDKIEILSGLSENEHLVIDGQNVVNNGDEVEEELTDEDGNIVIIDETNTEADSND